MKEYMFILAKESASINDTLVVLVDGVPVITGQFYLIPHLSKYWNTPIGGLGHIVARKMAVDISAKVMDIFSLYLSDLASNAKFVSVTIPGPNIFLIRSFEKKGFVYAEGFINMVSSTDYFRDQFVLPGLKIRNPIESDFDEIDEAYKRTPFPSRFVSDGGFDPEKARKLYVHRFREVYEHRLGEVFIAELEGKFVGALIGIINEEMAKTIGVKTNILSGMGIITHPRAARRGVSMHMIEHRQDWYKSKGVEYVNFGANFNNRPMILGLDKLGFKYGSLDVVLHRWT
jgi:GNAT superfamily N-acetyltransferase